MESLEKSIELSPIEGIKRICIQHYPNNGWCINFSIDLDKYEFARNDYFMVAGSMTIEGFLTSIKLFKKLKPSDFLFPDKNEDEVTKWVAEKDISWYIQKMKTALMEYPEYPKYRYRKDSQGAFTEYVKIISHSEVITVKYGLKDAVGYEHHISPEAMANILKWPELPEGESQFTWMYSEIYNKINNKYVGEAKDERSVATMLHQGKPS